MQLISVFILPLLLVSIPLYGLIRKVKVYEEFVVGAKEGFEIGVRIIPYLVGILFAIGMFRANGAMDWIIAGLNPVLGLIGFPAEVLPMGIMRSLTSSGSVGILADLIKVHGEDSILVKIAATMFGSTETTFYVIAVYFGAVGVRNSMYAIKAGLMADFAAAFASVYVCYLLFA
jgi:spore maturation protein B